jgi:hypothetical protein
MVDIVRPADAGRPEESHCPWVPSAPLAVDHRDNETAHARRYTTSGVSTVQSSGAPVLNQPSAF